MLQPNGSHLQYCGLRCVQLTFPCEAHTAVDPIFCSPQNCVFRPDLWLEGEICVRRALQRLACALEGIIPLVFAASHFLQVSVRRQREAICDMHP